MNPAGIKKLTEDELNGLSKDELVRQLLEMQSCWFGTMEELAIMKERMFGRKTEKDLVSSDKNEQLSLILNEFEAEEDEAIEEALEERKETTETITYTRKKHVGKREEDLEGLPVKVIEHTLTEEELKEAFGTNAYSRLPDTIYKKLEVIPTQYLVLEHHLATYKCNKTGKIVKATHPKELLNNSVATPSMVAAIMNAKYSNAMPLNRIESEMEQYNIHVGRQNMSHWVIQCTELYLSLIYDRLHKELLKKTVLQADETPLEVTKDGRKAGSKSYLWAYRTSELSKEPPIILYDYQKTRSSEHPFNYLHGFEGSLMCDGFDAYPCLAKKTDHISIANCLVHARRPFADIVKAMEGNQQMRGTTAKKALKLLQGIFAAESELKDLSAEERLLRRQQEVAPLVEAYFAWVEKTITNIAPNSAIGKALAYSLQRKDYLCKFLENGDIPVDNSATERSIRPWTVIRKNIVLIDTIHGAEASAVVLSLVQTAKANRLKPYYYLKYLLEEIPKHMDDSDFSFIDTLLPWSSHLPDDCRK